MEEQACSTYITVTGCSLHRYQEQAREGRPGLPGSHCTLISLFSAWLPAAFQVPAKPPGEAVWRFIWVFSPNANVSLGSWEPGLFEGSD